MKLRFASFVGLLTGVGLLAQLATLHAQPATPNRVLELVGNVSYVHSPPNIFSDLAGAMVEAWAKEESHGPCATQSRGLAC